MPIKIYNKKGTKRSSNKRTKKKTVKHSKSSNVSPKRKQHLDFNRIDIDELPKPERIPDLKEYVSGETLPYYSIYVSPIQVMVVNDGINNLGYLNPKYVTTKVDREIYPKTIYATPIDPSNLAYNILYAYLKIKPEREVIAFDRLPTDIEAIGFIVNGKPYSVHFTLIDKTIYKDALKDKTKADKEREYININSLDDIIKSVKAHIITKDDAKRYYPQIIDYLETKPLAFDIKNILKQTHIQSLTRSDLGKILGIINVYGYTRLIRGIFYNRKYKSLINELVSNIRHYKLGDPLEYKYLIDKYKLSDTDKNILYWLANTLIDII